MLRLSSQGVQKTSRDTPFSSFFNVFIFFTERAPNGGTKGTTVEPIGFGVQNLRYVVDKVKAKGFKIITSSELAPTQKMKSDIALLDGKVRVVAYALAPTV